MRWSVWHLACVAASCAAVLSLNGCSPAPKVGDKDGLGGTRIVTGAMIHGAGTRTEFSGRPVDLVATADGKTIWIKDMAQLRSVDAATNKLLGETQIPGGASLVGMALSEDGRELYVSNAASDLHVYDVANPASPSLKRTIKVAGKGTGASFPCGLTLGPKGQVLVCLSRRNTLGVVDLGSGELIKEIPVGVAPFGVVYHAATGTAMVTNQGGFLARAGKKTAPSSGTETEIDERGIAASGAVSFVDLKKGEATTKLCGLQPSAIALNPATGQAFVAETNADKVSVWDIKTQKLVRSLEIKPDAKLPFGSMPTALALDAAASRLYVANAGNNAAAVVDLKSNKVAGFIPADWYPSGVVATKSDVWILNNKGLGARAPGKVEGSPRNSHDKSATVLKIAKPTAAQLATMTKTVLTDSRVPQILAAQERVSKSTTKPVPIPKKLGEPSVFKHVIYVIKENRTYDQYFGDLPNADGEPKLNIFGEDDVPNHRTLARDFVLLDNYYCNGVLSADGHSWATEGNVTPYLNRAFGGFTRSYTFGDDPITYSSSGFVWDGVLAAGLSFRNYGEMDYAEPETPMNGRQIWEKYKAGENLKFKQNIGIENLRRYSCRDYPGWNMNIPDQLRMDRFLAEFKEFEKTGDLPNFIIVYLPQDHAGGAVTPRSHMADNDLAIGRLVEAVSKSKFWPETAIFINEDDPQAGTDHVDGHRSFCLVVSPYSRKRGTVSEFYNQTSVLRTIHHIFGILPMNQNDSASNLMAACFGEKADLSPYTAITPKTPLDEFPKQESAMSAPELALWRQIKKIDLRQREVQTPAEMDALNRWVWHSQKGFQTRYPSEWAGAHGRGLKDRGLKLDANVQEDDD